MTETYDLKLERVLEAPRPYQTPECEIELKPGGRFFTRMTGPDGFDYSATACILEAIPNERITWSTTMKGGYRPNEFADDGCNGFPFTAVHTFEDTGSGKTRYTATVMHANAKDRDAHAAMGFDEGWATCAEQMGEVARELAANT